jgi:murein L,D-transpeptidase YafK
VVRDALRGGQRTFQVQAYPFRMTPQNLAANHNDPNFAFWSDLKKGNDIFEVTRRPPKVSYCGKRYVFNTNFQGGEPRDPVAACPPGVAESNPAVASRSQSDQIAMQKLVASGTALTAHAYTDGGMHASFRKLLVQNGDKALSRRVSKTSVPISHPGAILADPQTTATTQSQPAATESGGSL